MSKTIKNPQKQQNPLNPEEWVDKYGNYLYSFALGRLRNPTEAENAVQETFLAAIKNKDTFSGKSSEKTWLTGILKHKIIDVMRKNYREKPVTDLSQENQEIDSFFDHANHLKSMPKKWLPDPYTLSENNEFWEVFRGCQEKLPEKTGDAFVLRELEQLDSKEICKTLNISESNYWVLMHRARLQLRQCLEDNWFGQ